MTFKRSDLGRGQYSAFAADGTHVAEISRFQTAWIAWHVPSNAAIQGPFGLGGSPFKTLRDAKRMISAIYRQY
jgi:hypothetical protein